jgi:MYXO-CTERM domain-containing protein
MTATLNPSGTGQPVTLTATVSGAGTPTGTLEFKDGGNTLSGPIPLSNGTASYTSSAMAQGTHIITAVYSGDANNQGSTSAVWVQTILSSSATSLTVTPNPSGYGEVVTLTATVSSSGTPAGTVQFMDNGNPLSGSVTLSNGVAILSTSLLSAGAHSIVAIYSGDTNTQGSTSAPWEQTVNRSSSITNLSISPNPGVYGQPVTLIATVDGNGMPTGTVQFTDNGEPLSGQITLDNGTATFTTSALAQGSHSITAIYSGDTNNHGSTSVTATLTINTQLGDESGDVPIPAWALLMLGAGLFGVMRRRFT